MEQRRDFMARIFPRVFKLASYVSVLALSSGLAMSYLITGWKDLDLFVSTHRGRWILIGGVLGFTLALFHFAVERRLSPMLASIGRETEALELNRIMRFLQVVPRLGLLVIATVFVLMMVAARGV